MPTLTLQPDATDGVDINLAKEAPTVNLGTEERLRVRGGDGVSDSADRSTLIRFDLSSIPSDATCDDATLSLWINALVGTTVTVRAFQPVSGNRDWTEGGATWNTKDGSNAWAGGNSGCAASGTDYDTTALGSISVTNGSAAGTLYEMTLSASVVQAAFGGQLHLLLLSNNQFADTDFRSSDHATSGERPKLVVNYTESGGATPDDVFPMSRRYPLHYRRDVFRSRAC